GDEHGARGFVGADVDRAADDAREACAALVGDERLAGGVEGQRVRARIVGRAAGDEGVGQGRAAVVGERGVEHGARGEADLVAVRAVGDAAGSGRVADDVVVGRGYRAVDVV